MPVSGKEELRIVVFGSSDDGGSALLRRLFHGSGTVPGDVFGDVSCRRLETARRKFVAICAPGPEQYVQGLVAGASEADLVIMLVDAGTGVPTRTRRHGYIASLIGIRRAVLAVDGMDPVDFDEGAFSTIVSEFRAFASDVGIETVGAVPVYASTGENVFAAGGNTSRYRGPSLVETLDTLDIGRDDPIAEGDRLSEAADQFAAHIVWMDARPMLPERRYAIRFAGASAIAQITDLAHRIDVDTLGRMAAKTLESNEIGYCKLSLDRPVSFDSPADNGHDGAFVLIDRSTDATVGAGVIGFALRRASNVVWQDLKIDKSARADAMGQRPCVLWLTGLPAAGKSTVADRVEQELQAQGRRTYLLDGDNVRHGLSRDLGFTDRDRVENIRRVAEVAKLMVDAGLIVIVSFVSPFRSEREMARAMVEEGEFFEIFVDTPLEVCEERDPKGLYAKARKGDLANFTGIDSPYEPPEDPDLCIDTTRLSPEEAAEAVVRLLQASERRNPAPRA